jgi:hypothetical protein
MEGQNVADLQHLEDLFLNLILFRCIKKIAGLHGMECVASGPHSCSRSGLNESMAEVASWERHKQ